MKRLLFLLPATLLLGACAGDTHTTEQSPVQPSRYVARSGAGSSDHRAGAPETTTFARGRIYEITRLETADQPRGEWRALGDSIRQSGSTISFTELGSGRAISFTAPHQITATSSMGDRAPAQSNGENPSEDFAAPSTRQ